MVRVCPSEENAALDDLISDLKKHQTPTKSQKRTTPSKSQVLFINVELVWLQTFLAQQESSLLKSLRHAYLIFTRIILCLALLMAETHLRGCNRLQFT